MITKHSAKAAQQSYSYSSTKIQKDLGFEFEGLEKTIQNAGKWFLRDN
jgi:hypothetical protein